MQSPSRLCTIPKKIVTMKTSIATQNVYHWTPLRRSCHHCIIVCGRASSSACLRIMRRLFQYLKFSYRRSCVHRLSLYSRAGSTALLPPPLTWAPSHFCDAVSFCGNRSENVRRVSFRNPAGKRGCLTDEMYLCWNFRKEMQPKTRILRSSSMRRRWSAKFCVHSISIPPIFCRFSIVNILPILAFSGFN